MISYFEAVLKAPADCERFIELVLDFAKSSEDE